MRRWDLLNEIAQEIDARTYLEIGCDSDVCFNKINVFDKTGVDPRKGGTHRMTSNEFFTSNIKIFDLVFVDGLHMRHQVVRDVENSLECLSDNGIIALHDAIPLKYVYQIVPLSAASAHEEFNGAWTGDVWKAVVDLRGRADIDVCTVPVCTGITLIKKRSNRNILTNIDELDWPCFVEKKQHLLNIIGIDEYKTWIKS